jgi:hypothetical protein
METAGLGRSKTVPPSVCSPFVGPCEEDVFSGRRVTLLGRISHLVVSRDHLARGKRIGFESSKVVILATTPSSRRCPIYPVSILLVAAPARDWQLETYNSVDASHRAEWFLGY